MRRLARHRPSPSLVISLIALFVSLGGVSYGLATGSINSRELKNNTVRSRDLRDNDVRGRDIRPGAVRGSDVGNDSLTGTDIGESTLGSVPFASRAGSANTAGSADSAGSVDGLSAARIYWRVPRNTPTQTILRLGGLVLTASCSDSPSIEPTVSATTTQNGAVIAVANGDNRTQTDVNDGNSLLYSDDSPFNTNEVKDVLAAGSNGPAATSANEDLQGSLTYMGPTGSVVTVTYLSKQFDPDDCMFIGNALGS